MFCNSGQMYMYFTWAALAGSLLLFFLHWRKRDSFNWKTPAVIAIILIGLGCYFLFIKQEPEEMRFMEYIQLRFGPFWSLTLSGFFILKCVVALGKKKS